jgi:hypothetical protein
MQPTLETVLWAWTNFGGIGAKTRRGCGALYCQDFAPKAYKDRSNVAVQGWSRRLPDDTDTKASLRPWPCLGRQPLARLIRPPQSDLTPVAAWRAAIESYRQFRQQGPAAYGIASFDSLGFASKGRMASPILLRPVAWAGGESAAPMLLPLLIGNRPDVRDAVAKVRDFFLQKHRYQEVLEY